MYDLILRDATIVTSQGRQVADVAIRDGLIAYVGPRPRRGAKQEISARGRFLMPGVIDTAVQFDPNGDATLWERESRAAVSGGVTTVLSLPAGDDPVVDSRSAQARLDRATGKSWVNFGLWGAAHDDNLSALDQAAKLGLIQGTMACLTVDEEPLSLHPTELDRYLNVASVLGVQVDTGDDDETITSALERVRANERNVHLIHLSRAEELTLLDPVRGATTMTAGVTPHHLFLSDEQVETDDGVSIHTRPPVRPEHDRRTLWTAVKRGRLDCVASDHHPSVPDNGSTQGVPGAELMFPLMLSAVKYGRLSLELLVSLCAEAPARIFGLDNKGRVERGADADLVLFSEGEITRVGHKHLMSSAGWSPYLNREAAPKPDLVIVGGEIVARHGEIVASAPRGQWVGAADN